MVKKNIGMTILIFSLLILNIIALSVTDYGWWLFFSLTTWIVFIFLLWHIAYSKFKIKRRFKNPYTLLLINSIFPILIFLDGTSNFWILTYIWFFFVLCLYCLSYILWTDYRLFLQKKSKSVNQKWLSGKRLKILQILMIFFIIAQAIVIFPYISEPIVAWKSEQNKYAIQRTVNELTKDCVTDKNKTIVLLNWFERHSGNMFNNWGLPTFFTGFRRQLCLSFGDGHDYFYLFCNLYIRTLNRDYPSWVFTTRSGRCEEYSILFREMAHASNLTVRTVVCQEMDHLWDEVLIDGNWTVVDPANVVANKHKSGFDLPKADFIKGFTSNDVSYIFAEYPDGRKETVTGDYVSVNNMSYVNISTVDENNNPVSNVDITVLSNNRAPGQDIGLNFTTDEKGRYQLQIGKGSLTLKSKTGGFIYLSNETTKLFVGNQSYNIIIVMKNECCPQIHSSSVNVYNSIK